jgi:hypothetical protein
MLDAATRAVVRCAPPARRLTPPTPGRTRRSSRCPSILQSHQSRSTSQPRPAQCCMFSIRNGTTAAGMVSGPCASSASRSSKPKGPAAGPSPRQNPMAQPPQWQFPCDGRPSTPVIALRHGSRRDPRGMPLASARWPSSIERTTAAVGGLTVGRSALGSQGGVGRLTDPGATPDSHTPKRCSSLANCR